MEHRGDREVLSERRISHAACVARVHVAYEVGAGAYGRARERGKERAIATEKEGQARRADRAGTLGLRDLLVPVPAPLGH